MENLLITTLTALLLSSSAPAMDGPLSADLMRHTKSVCDAYDVPVSLALAVMSVESGFDADAVNYDGTCVGLMQIHTGNAKWLLRDADADIYTPEGNITAGVYILSLGLERYGDTELALIWYNCGTVADGVTSTGYSRKVVARVPEYEIYDEPMPRLRRPAVGGDWGRVA